MALETDKKEISLLPRERFRKSIGGRISYWLITIGRYVIIFTELVVVAAFLSRFYFDRKNADLSEKIRQQKAILLSVSDFEKDYLLFQKRLKTVADKISVDQDFSEPLDIIAKDLHPDVSVVGYSFNIEDQETRISLRVESLSVSGISFSVTSLSGDPRVEKVRLESVSKEKGKKIEAKLTIILKPKGARDGSKQSGRT